MVPAFVQATMRSYPVSSGQVLILEELGRRRLKDCTRDEAKRQNRIAIRLIPPPQKPSEGCGRPSFRQNLAKLDKKPT